MPDLRVGIAGLGAASKRVLPCFASVAGVRCAGAADIRADARAAFTRDYGLPAFETVDALCRSPGIDAIWIETPNRLHCEHAITAAGHGKHVICAKPLAATLDECDHMIAASSGASVKLLLGHSKIFDSPIRAMADAVKGGGLGRLVQIDSWFYNDWLLRPRLAEELDETLGAGFTLRQAPHLVDIVTHIAGARALSVRALAGRGHCAALIAFDNGASAAFSLNGHGWFGTSELTWDIGIFGERRAHAKPKPATGPLSETEKYAAMMDRPHGQPDSMPFAGLTLVSCERGVLRQSPQGIYLYTDKSVEEIVPPPNLGRAAELIELRDAIAGNRDVFPNGPWAKANLEICLAILASSREEREIVLRHQTR